MSGLTRSITDRIFVGLLGLVFAPLSGFVLYLRYTRANPADDLDWLAQGVFFLAVQFVTLVFLGSVLSVVWALFTPAWVEGHLRRVFLQFGKLLMVIAAVLICVHLWFQHFKP